jgi:ATP-dependent Clp protease ATP-binding subunit ClpA
MKDDSTDLTKILKNLTPKALQVLRLAEKEVELTDPNEQGYVETTHLLLAILECGSTASNALKRLGVTRQRLLKAFGWTK